LNPLQNPKKPWELLNELTSKNKSKSNSNIPFIISNGNKIDTPQEIATEFNSFFVNAGQSIVNSVPATDTSPESFLPNPDSETPEFDLGNISPTHILDIIKSFQNKSSLDIDGISLKLLKFIGPTICTPLAHIFNLSFMSGIFPTKLKLNRTVPIFKSGDPNSCDNYRLISLIPSFSKILEKIVTVNLTNHLQLNNLLHKNQYGFQRNLSTEHNLLQVMNFISNSLNKGNYCIGVFLDLRKAFDTCSHDILLKKLSKLGINNTALEWFQSYLTSRSQKVDINGNFSNILSNLWCLPR
jgi:hypothetical protein